MTSTKEIEYKYTPLDKPVPITEHQWPEGILPLVNTITKTFMHERFIRDCIEGILMQKTSFPVRVLIIDDASTDKTADVIREYEKKYPNLIMVHYQSKNTYSMKDLAEKRRLRAPFNKLRVGKYEALCEGDDCWTDPLKLQKQITFLENHSDVSFCVGGYIQKIDGKSERHEIIKRIDNAYGCQEGFIFILDNMEREWLTKTLTLAYRKSKLEEVDFSKYKYYERDIYITYHLAKNSKGFYFTEVFGLYNVHEGGINSTKQGKVNLNIAYECYRQLFELYKDEFTRCMSFKSAMALFSYDLYHSYKENSLKKKLSLFFYSLRLVGSLKEVKIFLASFIPREVKDKINDSWLCYK